MPKIQEVLPKYLQIANHYKDQITRGELKPGDKLPSDRQIAQDWEVVRPTAEKAVKSLQAQGIVERRQGSGTYVLAQRGATRARELYYARARQFGRIYAPGWRAEIRSATLVPAPDYVAEALELQTSDQVVRRHRVTMNDVGEPVEMSVSWLAGILAVAAPKLVGLERIRIGSVGYVESMTGRVATHALDRVAARSATEEERTALRLEGESAVLVYRHTVYDQDDQPLEFAEATYAPNVWAIEQTYPIEQ